MLSPINWSYTPPHTTAEFAVFMVLPVPDGLDVLYGGDARPGVYAGCVAWGVSYATKKRISVPYDRVAHTRRGSFCSTMIARFTYFRGCLSIKPHAWVTSIFFNTQNKVTRYRR